MQYTVRVLGTFDEEGNNLSSSSLFVGLHGKMPVHVRVVHVQFGYMVYVQEPPATLLVHHHFFYVKYVKALPLPCTMVCYDARQEMLHDVVDDLVHPSVIIMVTEGSCADMRYDARLRLALDSYGHEDRYTNIRTQSIK